MHSHPLRHSQKVDLSSIPRDSQIDKPLSYESDSEASGSNWEDFKGVIKNGVSAVAKGHIPRGRGDSNTNNKSPASSRNSSPIRRTSSRSAFVFFSMSRKRKQADMSLTYSPPRSAFDQLPAYTTSPTDLIDLSTPSPPPTPRKRRLLQKSLRESISTPSFLISSPSIKSLDKRPEVINHPWTPLLTPPLPLDLLSYLEDHEFHEMMNSHANFLSDPYARSRHEEWLDRIHADVQARKNKTEHTECSGYGLQREILGARYNDRRRRDQAYSADDYVWHETLPYYTGYGTHGWSRNDYPVMNGEASWWASDGTPERKLRREMAVREDPEAFWEEYDRVEAERRAVREGRTRWGAQSYRESKRVKWENNGYGHGHGHGYNDYGDGPSDFWWNSGRF
ncbi:hypothetical protein BJ508DRAFT_141444 [Ascobolus immersus RN42]|uniref:Uncharacterized protein n=1 Tax=Ascobolus immersus RN42 TaxID=1160509 RepID=A0A3N4I037_ASCIM|nr:hypothetical protein BJ508DRAFT_141444 [Ascobolus immersus RN42]